MQTQFQLKPAITPPVRSARVGPLQRKCTCGGTPGPSGECEECRKQKRGGKANSATLETQEASEVPPIVHDALRSPGQPLDAATRALMEERFGHNFGDVRVHIDSEAVGSARMLNALAYTVGNEMVFGTDQYRPETGVGRLLLAHELAHTIQQKRGTRDSVAEDSVHEQDADRAVGAAMLSRPIALSSTAVPSVQFLKVSSGALGKALEEFTTLWNVPERAITLLRKSPSFMKLAAILDMNYVWRGDSYKVDPAGERGTDGRLTKGPFKGKRELMDVIFGKPEFEPYEAAPEPGKIKLSGDVISIESTDVPGFISEIAHEATHAARFVRGAAPPAGNIVAEVNASITDEVETRKSEARILGEIPARDVQARAAQVGTRIPAEVERDISPAFGLTYVENAFFAAQLREAQAKDGITDEDADKIREEVEKDFQGKTLPGPKLHFKPQLGSSGLYELSDYGDIWFNRRLAQREWQQFLNDHKPTEPDFAIEKEKAVQDHAKRFFEGRVSYQPLP